MDTVSGISEWRLRAAAERVKERSRVRSRRK
jgi:hypothetical protein